MKVKELKERLDCLDDDLEIVISDLYDNCYNYSHTSFDQKLYLYKIHVEYWRSYPELEGLTKQNET